MSKLEYFRKDVIISGRHATLVDEMWKQNDIDNSFFKRLVDLYTIAPVIGLRTGRKAVEDNSTDNKRTIQLAQIMTRREDLMTIMQIILLTDDTDNLTVEQKVDRTFRGPTNEEEFNKNVALFDSYVRGGIEVLYEKLINRALSVDDPYTDRKIGNIMALLNGPLVEE